MRINKPGTGKYAVALTHFMEENGTGESAESAVNPCLTSNEYDWLQFRAELGNLIRKR